MRFVQRFLLSNSTNLLIFTALQDFWTKMGLAPLLVGRVGVSSGLVPRPSSPPTLPPRNGASPNDGATPHCGGLRPPEPPGSLRSRRQASPVGSLVPRSSGLREQRLGTLGPFTPSLRLQVVPSVAGLSIVALQAKLLLIILLLYGTTWRLWEGVPGPKVPHGASLHGAKAH